MEDIVTLTLPKGASAQFVRDIQDALGGMEAVADSGELGTRGLDVQTIGVWVKLAADSVHLNGNVIAVVRELFGVVRAHAVPGAKLTVGENVIELGEMSLDQLEQTMARVTATAA